MVSVAFTGDIAFSKYFTGAYERDFISNEVKDFLRNSDHVVANVEGCITAGNFARPGGLKHATSPDAIPTLLDLGAKIWTLANNHTMDCGAEGLEDTLRLAAENGVTTVGAGMNIDEAAKPIYLEGAGGIGIFSVVYDTKVLHAEKEKPGCLAHTEEEYIRKNIAEIKSKCRWCIVVSHAGAEFSHLPLPYIRKRYLNYLKMGADFVIGHHPHVVENYEIVGKKAIFYSLGNFIFDTDYQRNQRYTENGVLLRLNLTEEGYAFEAMATHIDRETMSVVKGELPAHFKHLSPFQYHLLWPHACVDYSANNRNAVLFLHPDYAQQPLKMWFDRAAKAHGKAFAVQRYYTMPFVEKCIPLWRLGDKEVLDYISDKK